MSDKFEDSELQKQELLPASNQVSFPDGGWSAWATVLGSYVSFTVRIHDRITYDLQVADSVQFIWVRVFTFCPSKAYVSY